MLERVLGKARHEVVCVQNGAKAFDAFQRESFDVVLTDLRMPETDGMALPTKIRAHDAGVPVLVFTGAPDTQSAIEAVNLRATRYLSKPLAPTPYASRSKMR
jgi:two-component system response regulator HydG